MNQHKHNWNLDSELSEPPEETNESYAERRIFAWCKCGKEIEAEIIEFLMNKELKT
jgi:hypothetical protein